MLLANPNICFWAAGRHPQLARVSSSPHDI
jgi:hypothetical protein